MNYIYLHGFCSGAHSFKGSYFKKKFAEKNKILHTPDLNGGDFEHLTISSQLKIISELAGTLQGDMTLLGSSLGGYLACLFAQTNHRVKKLVLIAPAFQFISRHEKILGKDLLGKWRRTGWFEVYHYEYRENRRLHYGIIDDARKYDRLPLTRKIPALLMHGIHDQSVPYHLSIDYLKTNPEARLILFNSDHTMTDIVDTLYECAAHFLEL